jgi:RNA 2',3'-cyclic 3'-phosphodiesterase
LGLAFGSTIYKLQPGVFNVSPSVRTFIAVPVPDPVRATVAAFTAPLKRLDPDVKWVRPEGVHLTLKFLGDVETGRLGAVGDAVADAVADVRAFGLRLGGSGFFPNAKRPNVLWIGVASGAEDLSRLAEAVETAAAGCGFERERRPFSAHLTVGRVRSTRGIDRLASHLSGNRYESEPFAVETVLIMKSDLQRTGAVYSTLRTLKLKA